MRHIVKIKTVLRHHPRKIDHRQPPFTELNTGNAARSVPVRESRPNPKRSGCVINTGTICHARHVSASAFNRARYPSRYAPCASTRLRTTESGNTNRRVESSTIIPFVVLLNRRARHPRQKFNPRFNTSLLLKRKCLRSGYAPRSYSLSWNDGPDVSTSLIPVRKITTLGRSCFTWSFSITICPNVDCPSSPALLTQNSGIESETRFPNK